MAGLDGGAQDGGFVVVWEGYNQTGDASGYGVVAQLFAADGTKVGGEFLLNSTTSGNQFNPTVTALDGGKFAATWTDNNSVILRVFNADGTAATGEIAVSQSGSDDETQGWIAENVTTLEDGGIAVSWESYDGSATAERWDIYTRVFNADGTARSNELQVNTTSDNNQHYGSIGALEGTGAGYVVTWSDPYSADGSNWGIFAQRFAADGTAVGGEFQVNTYTYSTQIYSKVVGLSDGGFVIAWQSYGVDGNNYTISGQRYAADGTAVDGEFIIPDTTFSQDRFPSLAVRNDGALIAVWESDDTRRSAEATVSSWFEDDLYVRLRGKFRLGSQSVIYLYADWLEGPAGSPYGPLEDSSNIGIESRNFF